MNKWDWCKIYDSLMVAHTSKMNINIKTVKKFQNNLNIHKKTSFISYFINPELKNY